VAGLPARVYRVSFSGEIAYEINVPASCGTALWHALMTAGAKYQITPYGTEAMHVLRGEKGFIVVGHDTDGTQTPQDLGMDWIVSKKKKDFIGKRSLSRSDAVRPDRKHLVGLLTENPNEVMPEGSQIVAEVRPSPPMPMDGHVTSSYWSPILGRSIAMAVLKGGHNRRGETVTVALPERNVRAAVTAPQFYDPEGERIRG
jgi:sarcosine oxidase subunit alpha